jgi:hypothetical protein
MRIWRYLTSLALLGVLALFPGCASSSPTKPKAAKQAGHWVYLPSETGSNLPRRVWQNDDGTMVDPTTGRVFQGSKDNVAELQRLQSVAPASQGR